MRRWIAVLAGIAAACGSSAPPATRAALAAPGPPWAAERPSAAPGSAARPRAPALVAASPAAAASPARGHGPRGAAQDSVSRARRARALFEHAEEALARNSIDQRRLALRSLEQASLLEPAEPLYDLTLARAYYRAGFLKLARQRYEKVTRLAPGDVQGRFGLGLVWRRDWLKYLDRSSLERSIEHFSAAARLEPRFCEAWLMLVPLLVEQGQLATAAAAAEHAVEADSARPEAQLARAYTAWREGHVERAASAFARAIPRLRRGVRERFEDIAPLATEADTAALRRLPAGEQPDFLRRFWRDLDPDLATPENEAQLEYWARVTHAYFLYYDERRRAWDERGEIYVRYGPPEHSDYNPVGERLSTMRGGAAADLHVVNADFPANVLRWDYPSLGMSVKLMDLVLSERYVLPASLYSDPDPVPDPDSVAQHPERFSTEGGRGVFPRLPPGVHALAVRGAVARFEADSGARLLAEVEAPGSPVDSLWGEWVVLDSLRREVARGGRPLMPSACDPAARRVADFSEALPAGDYLVGLTVRDAHGDRGVWRAPVRVRSAPAELGLSDVMITCGTPDPGAGPPLRIPANPAATIGPRDPLHAYFEIYRLTPDRGGAGRFLYEYSVRGAQKDPRIWIQRLFQPRSPLPSLSASREEENPGPMRRQFVTVPIQTLPPGRYRLEIRVRDLVGGAEVVRSAEFEKRAADAP